MSRTTAGSRPGRIVCTVGALMYLPLVVLLCLLFPASAQAQAGQEVQVEYYHLDALGSVRVVTDDAGQVIARHDFLPFGEEWNPQSTAKEKRLFTGHERDAETGLDYFGARYYRPQVGRFTTVDPVMNVKGNLVNPKKWNRYAYVLNNPLIFIDRGGREEDAAYSLYLIRDQVRRIGGDAAVAQMDRRNAIMGLSVVAGLATGAVAAEAVPSMMPLGQRLLNWLGNLFEPELRASGRVIENDLHHVFDKAGRGLEWIVDSVGQGSTAKAWSAVEQAATKALAAGGQTSGVFETPVELAGRTVITRGKIIDGAVYLSTFFNKPQ